jgi:hypothetical protein
MSNPVVLITGGLTGIGRAAALASELLATGAEAEFIRADVRFEDDSAIWSTALSPAFGRLDVALTCSPP